MGGVRVHSPRPDGGTEGVKRPPFGAINAAMLTRPNVADDRIIHALRQGCGLAVDSLTFLPVGNDFRAWSYRLDSGADSYFVKLRRGELKPSLLRVPHYLRALGIANVVAPLPALSGGLSSPLGGDFSLILYPFIEGKSAWGMALSPAQWTAWGQVMRKIHAAPVDSQLAHVLERERYGVKWLDAVADVEDSLRQGNFASHYQSTMLRVWRENADEIETCKARFAQLGARLADENPPCVICHADIHTANIIIAHDGEIHIVDWDECLLAPRERDLMFFIGDGHAAAHEAAFLAGYGGGEVDRSALAYYRYDWCLQEFADYGERMFLSSDVGEEDLALSLREFKRLFAPGDVIQRAHEAFARIPD